ncbi:MAG: hypothetical protein V4772_25180 [Pseudomonadota bacterium]
MKNQLKAITSAVLSAALLSPLVLTISGMAYAAPAEKLQQGAGPLPRDSQVRAAILKYLSGTDRALNKQKPFKILSGPPLATGNTVAGGLEQAWLMCIVVNAEKIAPGPQQLEGKSLYLQRSKSGEVLVVPIENWKDSSPQC